MRPECAICHNKVHDNFYIWVEREQRLVHKVCQMINNEIRRDVIVKVEPLGVRNRVGIMESEVK